MGITIEFVEHTTVQLTDQQC